MRSRTGSGTDRLRRAANVACGRLFVCVLERLAILESLTRADVL